MTRPDQRSALGEEILANTISRPLKSFLDQLPVLGGFRLGDYLDFYYLALGPCGGLHICVMLFICYIASRHSLLTLLALTVASSHFLAQCHDSFCGPVVAKSSTVGGMGVLFHLVGDVVVAYCGGRLPFPISVKWSTS